MKLEELNEMVDPVKDWFGDNKSRELKIGERIREGDIFIQNGKVYPATDVGSGVYSSDHFKHYRIAKDA